MTEQVKQHTIKVLEFLKDFKDIDHMTLGGIQERFNQYEDLLIGFVEKLLKDKEDENGTLTSWWLYENVDKKIYHEVEDHQVTYDVEDSEDFVNYMLER